MKMCSLRALIYGPLFAICAAVAGCVTPGQMRYSEYTGHDASSSLGMWPIGQGSMAETSYAVPVYRGWPEKPYQVLGSLSFPDQNAHWNEDFFSAAAKRAKSCRGDAIIVRQGAEFGVSKIAGAKTDPLLIASTYQTTALVIRWLTAQEIKDRALLLNDFIKRFSLNDPRVAANRSVSELVIIHLLQTGVDLKSEQLFTRFDETLKSLATTTPETLAGNWIYKASFSVSTMLSGGDERNALGVATVSVDGENIAIVSSNGGVELNFTGTLNKGRLSGQMGVGGISAKCEGASTAEKMSVSFQSLTSDGTARGNVVFQRLIPKSNENEKTPPAHGVKHTRLGGATTG